MCEQREHIKNLIYYAAKDGMSLKLYTIMCEVQKTEVERIVNEVRIVFECFFVVYIIILCSIGLMTFFFVYSTGYWKFI